MRRPDPLIGEHGQAEFPPHIRDPPTNNVSERGLQRFSLSGTSRGKMRERAAVFA